jgi:hypothetical protein
LNTLMSCVIHPQGFGPPPERRAEEKAVAFTVSGIIPLAGSLRVKAGNISTGGNALCLKRRGRPSPASARRSERRAGCYGGTSGGLDFRPFRQDGSCGRKQRPRNWGIMTSVTNKAAYPKGWRLWGGRVTVSEFGGGNNQPRVLSLTTAVGRITQSMMGSRKTGRVWYAPLRRYNGGEAGSRL